MFSTIFSGGITGFIFTLFIFLLTSWWNFKVKIGIILFITIIYTLNEFNLIKLKIPQNHWQIPTSWVNNKNDRLNMLVWGGILGAGIFTYIPHITFYILYLYIGMFSSPILGLIFGMVYGLARTLPTILIAFNKSYNQSESSMILDRLLEIKRLGYTINGLTLTIFTIFIIATKIL
ncbi:MAG: hypothetical protein ABGX20_23300 [Bacillus sp. (in: firmicutes)]